MAEFKIEAIAPETKAFSGKFGEMVSYKVKLPNVNDPVEIVQKATTPAPKVGDVLTGTVESSQFGPKFKKEFTPKVGGGSKPQADPFTMYLSYAKDIAAYCIKEDEGKFNNKLYSEILEAVLAGGAQLYAGRPEAGGTNKVQTVEMPDEMPKDFLDPDFFDQSEQELGHPK